MLKVVAVVDKVGTALDRLAKGVATYMHLDYQVVDVHPKRPSAEQLDKFAKAAKNADLIDWQYYRTAEMLRSVTPWLGDKKHILTHNNPYSIHEADWNNYDMVVANNETMYEELGNITTSVLEYVPLTVDTEFWTYKREWEPNKTVIMVANRIESKKGILPVAIACGDLGLKLILVGAVSDPEYMHAVMGTGSVEFHEQISDEELRKLYWGSTLHVCNSIDNYESGTLPIIEAMLCGVPVLTRKIGHVPDLFNGENMIVSDHDPEDVVKITQILKEAFESDLSGMRSKAWDTAKVRSHERRAYMYQKLYRKVMWPDQKSVSVVMPIYGEPNEDTIKAVLKQDYQNLELIICNDDPNINRFRFDSSGQKLVHVIDEPSDGYGLAKQRNLGIIEATGDIMVFCDQRMLMEPNAVSEFVENLQSKRWVYGNKGTKKEFVENFSAIDRLELIKAGMFNERIDAYGGMSQEIRSRMKLQGFKLEYIDSAKATPQGSSKNKHTKRQEIIRMKNRLWKMGLQL